MDQTPLLAAGMGLAGVILAALAGFGGAILGSRVAAAATREAAQRAQAEAQADREEARRARFADRIRELSAGLLGTTSRVLVEIGDQLEFRHRRPTDRPPVVQMDIPRLVQDAQELGLLVRSGPATESIDPLVQERPLGEPQFLVSDDAGTDYGVRPAGRTGNGREMKGEALVVPGPPEEATTMRVELTGFAAPRFPPMGSEDVRGTWHFEFAIRG